MKSSYPTLPPQAYKAIDRWYYITCTLIALTFITLSGLSVYYYLQTRACVKEYHMLAAAAQHNQDHAVESYLLKKITKIQTNRFNPTTDLKLFATLTPETITLTRYTYNRKKKRSLAGSSTTSEAVQQMALKLSKFQAWKSLVLDDLHTTPEKTVTFHIMS